MAKKAAPGTLVHCDTCGEDYSTTYKRCPFCGEKSDKYFTASFSSVKDEIPEDDYIFDGGDLFDDMEDYEDENSRPRGGGKRLNQERSSSPPINWPRIITFACSLIIIAAALVIIFAYIYPKIHDPGTTKDPSSIVSNEPSNDPGDIVITDDPNDPVTTAPVTSDPVGNATDTPTTEPTTPVDNPATGIKLSKVDFTLQPDEDWTIKAEVSPATWSGTITWTSSDTSLATVDQNGTVTNVNTGKYLLPVTITATAGGQTATATVYCTGGSTPPAQPSTSTGENTGTFKLNREDFSLTIGDDDKFQMKATGVDSVIWSIADPTIATIDENGLVTAVSKGKTIITATAPDGTTVTCIVRVRNG